MFSVRRCASLSILFLSMLVLPARADIGGNDVTILEHSELFQAQVAYSDAGHVYVAVERFDEPGTSYAIDVYRSEDQGESWSLWGTVGDELANTNHLLHRLYIAPGPNALCYVLHTMVQSGSAQLVMARSPMAGASASFSMSSVFPMGGVSYDDADMVCDAPTHENYFIYVVASVDDGDGRDIWFTRSRTYATSWSMGYRIGISEGAGYELKAPRIAYGADHRLHVVWSEEDWPAINDWSISYRRANDHANAGGAAWDPIRAMTQHGSGYDEVRPAVAASGHSDEVLITWSRKEMGTLLVYDCPLWVSTDAGASWPRLQKFDLSPLVNSKIVELPPGEGWCVMGNTPEGARWARRSRGDNPLTWQPEELYTDTSYSTNFTRPGAVYAAGTYGNFAWAWVDRRIGIDTLYFDATWLGAPGMPNFQSGSPVAIAASPQTAPAVVDIDGDDQLEIVWGDFTGKVQVYEPGGFPRPGWPVDIGFIPRNSPVAVGDLRGGAPPLLVAGNASGWVHCWDADGNVMPGWPVNLGTGEAVYVSIGALSPPYARYVVACSTNKLWVINYAGVVQPGYPFNFSGTFLAPAAIGDVDGDGHSEIVSLTDGWVHVNNMHQATPEASRNLTPKTTDQPPSLADFDLDGDLEIVVPTMQGDVYVMHHDLSDYPPWPYSDPDAQATTAVALAQIVGGPSPELAFAHYNSEVHLFYDNRTEPLGWPHSVDPAWWIYGGPIVEQVDDLSPDVVISSGDSYGYAWNNVNTLVAGWPKFLHSPTKVSPASGDIDDDGRMEVVFVNRDYLVILDVGPMESPLVGEQYRWPMFMHDPQRSSCADCPENLATAVGPLPSVSTLSLRMTSRNPSMGQIMLSVDLPQRSEVELVVYDARGRALRRLMSGWRDPGSYPVSWDGRDLQGRALANGVYFARLQVSADGNAERRVQKVMLLR